MFIAENGTFVVYKGKELIVNSLEKNIAKELIEIGRTIPNSYVILCGKNSAYIESHDERLIKQTAKYYERYKIVEDLTSIDDDILKVTICDFNGSENNSNNYFDEYRDQFFKKGGTVIDFTRLEKSFLKLLIARRNEVTDYDMIKDIVWKGKEMSIYTMRNIVNKIRQKTYYEIIKNHSSKGYTIDIYKGD